MDLPMIVRALDKAKSRLNSTYQALEALRVAEADDEINDRWVDFLMHWKSTYSKVQQAAKQTAQEKQWFGDVNNERRKDPLLRYIFEARNDEEHGLVQSVERDLSLTRMDIPPQPEGTELRIGISLDGQFGIINQSGELLGNTTTIAGGGVSLNAVTERDGKKQVQPPTSHFDNPIEPRPLPVAEAGFTWLANLVGLADAMHIP